MKISELTTKIQQHAKKIITHDIELIHNNIELNEKELVLINNYHTLCTKLVKMERYELEKLTIDKDLKTKLYIMLEALEKDTTFLVKALKNNDTDVFEEKIEPYLKNIDKLLELETKLKI